MCSAPRSRQQRVRCQKAYSVACFCSSKCTTIHIPIQDELTPAAGVSGHSAMSAGSAEHQAEDPAGTDACADLALGPPTPSTTSNFRSLLRYVLVPFRLRASCLQTVPSVSKLRYVLTVVDCVPCVRVLTERVLLSSTVCRIFSRNEPTIGCAVVWNTRHVNSTQARMSIQKHAERLC
jgi:hypothetical protein